MIPFMISIWFITQNLPPAARPNINMPSYKYRDFHYKDKTISRPPYLYNGKNGLSKLPWTSYLHAILRIISRGVSGLPTDSPCRVWDRGWTTCLLHDSPFFGSYFKMSWYVSLEWYFIYLLLFLASVYGFMHETSDFLLYIIPFSYTKYFVHSYTVDVVFTLSYSFYNGNTHN